MNQGFDGDRDLNLLSRRNRLRAGEEAEIIVLVSSAIPRDDVLDIDFSFLAQSVTDTAVQVDVPTVEVEAASSTGGASPTAWFNGLSVEEQRLIGLGAAVIALIVAVFIVRAVRRTRELLRELETRRAITPGEDEDTADEPEEVVEIDVSVDPEDIAEPDVINDLDENVVLRDDTSIDVRERAHPLNDDAELIESPEPHHRPRRRRGRRKVERS